RVAAAQDLRPLQKLLLLKNHVAVIDEGSRCEGLVVESKQRRMEFFVALRIDGVHGCSTLSPVIHIGGEYAHPISREGVFAIEDHCVPGEKIETRNHDLRSVGEQLLPAREAGMSDRCGDDAEVAASLVGADVEEVAAVVD